MRDLAPDRAPAAGPLGVALSGGGDSVALLLLLRDAGWPAERLVAVHVDHGLRAASAAEADWTASFCAEQGVRCDVRTLAWRSDEAPDAAAVRDRRQAALRAAAAAHGLGAIALAHTADDQRETRWLALARGAGLRGLAGMRRWQPPWWRPLLQTPRAVLRAHLLRRGQGWCEDPSNVDFRHPRARLRHVVLPALARPWTSAEALRTDVLQDEDALLDRLAFQALDWLLTDGALDRRRGWDELDVALQRRLLRLWLGRGVALERVEALRQAVARPASRLRHIELGQGQGAWLGPRWVLALAAPPRTEVAAGARTTVAWGHLGTLRLAAAGPLAVVPAGDPARAADRRLDAVHERLRGADLPAVRRAAWPVVLSADDAWAPPVPLSRAAASVLADGTRLEWAPTVVSDDVR